ncbi:MAG: three-Cys-motif partner protein TcmP [Planctomycetes bacterium]|nr:three-Cys-motif partner protein TcmP [Planctomycetota bacterium]
MPRRSDKSFFCDKKYWSKRKDLILGYYLKPYLPKIATQRRPILIVDAFAGPGKFDDGEAGSPLIICSHASAANAKPLPVPVEVLCIEPDNELYDRLEHLLGQFPFASARHGEFLEYLPEIERKASTHSVFLYVDPFTVEGLDWRAMDRLFQHVGEGHSVEVLVNFNSRSFVRRGLAALRIEVPSIDPDNEDDLPVDAETAESPSLTRLDAVVGGGWWREVLRRPDGFPQQVQAVADGYCDRLRERFSEVCPHPVKALPHHTIAKYYLILGSRSPHALPLINDAMAKSREMLADLAKPAEPTLFETRTFELVPGEDRLRDLLLERLTGQMPRGALINKVMRTALGDYSSTQIRRCIAELIKAGTVQSATRRHRIPDRELVWRAGG